jgi:diguanylate cyclase (GGDEF)-like protein
MAGKRVLLVDPDEERRKVTVVTLKLVHIKALTAGNGDEALELMEAEGPDLIICDQEVEGHSAQELCEYVHEFMPGYVHFVLVVDQQEEDPEEVRRKVGADVVLRRPLSEDHLGVVCSMLLRLSELRTRVAFLEDENIGLRRSLGADLYLDTDTQFYRFDIFKHIILMEIKKAKRYGYVVSLLMMAFDNYTEMMGWLDPDQRHNLFDLLKKATVNNIRDIDIPLLFSEDKILVVMPHTDLKSAAIVADRIRSRVGEIKVPASLAKLELSTSAAVASTQADPDAGFGTMIQNAMQGLKQAEEKGGNAVMVCRSPRQEKEAELNQDELGQLGPQIHLA